MPELDADFEISTNNLEAEYEISEGQTFDCSFEIYASGTTWEGITGSPYDNEALSDILNQKADSSVVETLSDTVNNIENTIDSYGNIVTYDYTDFATAQQGLKADTALQPNDNISELVNNVGYLVLTDLDNYATLSDLATKQDIINDLTDIRSNASKGASAYSTIQNYGNIVTHNASEFATSTQGSLADTALQPNDNITELNNNAGYITAASLPTVNNSKITIQRNNTDIGDFNLNQAQPKSININVPTQASDIGAVPTTRTVNNKALNTNITLDSSDVSALPSSTTIEDLTTTAQQNAINSGATTTKIGQITTNANDITDIQDLIPTQATSTNQLADKSFVNSSIATNTAYFIGTFNSVAELEAYTGTLTNNDYAFVETTDSAGNTLYDRYKWNGTQWLFEYELNNSSFTANQWASINSGITSSDVALINTALQPNDNITQLTNNAGYITNADLSGYAQISDIPTDVSELNNDSGYITGITSSDVTTALGYTPYNSTNPNGYISGIGSSDVISALGYTPYNSTNPSGYITGISSSDVITALGYTPYNSSNPNGYTSNVGTVTSVNNTQPDVNGNVTISVSGGANTDLSNLTATGEAHFLKNSSSIATSLTISGTASTYQSTVNLGVYSAVGNPGSTALGYNSQSSGSVSIALGYNATSSANSAIQIGQGTNSTANSLAIGFGDDSEHNPLEYQLLDGITGLIPDARISSNFEKTSNKVTSISSSSTNTQYPSAKCVYDELADVVRQEATDTINLYCWSSSSYDFYTTSETPNIGDHVYNTNYDVIGKIAVVISSTEISVAPYEGLYQSSCIRDTSKDTTFIRRTLTDNNSNALNIVQADGQWTWKMETVSSVTALGSYDLTSVMESYLPDDNYSYEVLFRLGINRNDNSGTNTQYYLFDPDLITSGQSVGKSWVGIQADGANWQQGNAAGMVILKPNRKLTLNLAGYKLASSECIALAYRRIGTNA